MSCPCSSGPSRSPCRMPVLEGDTLCGYHRELFNSIDRRAMRGLRRELADDLDVGLDNVVPMDWDGLGVRLDLDEDD